MDWVIVSWVTVSLVSSIIYLSYIMGFTVNDYQNTHCFHAVILIILGLCGGCVIYALAILIKFTSVLFFGKMEGK